MIELVQKGLLVFGAMFALDFMWAQYVMHTADRSKLMSSGFATVIILTTGFVTIRYTEDARMLFPAAFGAFFGTYASLLWDERKGKRVAVSRPDPGYRYPGDWPGTRH